MRAEELCRENLRELLNCVLVLMWVEIFHGHLGGAHLSDMPVMQLRSKGQG